jgi:hypothetical protein
VNPKASSKRSQTLSARSDGNGDHQIHSEILRELPRDEFAVVSPKLEFVRLHPRQVLHEAGDTLRSQATSFFERAVHYAQKQQGQDATPGEGACMSGSGHFRSLGTLPVLAVI